MQNPRSRTVYGQQKLRLPAPVRKIMALGRKMFSLSVKCFAHGLRGYNGGAQRRLVTQTVTMLTSCW